MPHPVSCIHRVGFRDVLAVSNLLKVVNVPAVVLLHLGSV